MNGETQGSATTGSLAFVTPATSASPAGTYAIDGSGLTATNYTFTQAAGNATALTLNAVAPITLPAGVTLPAWLLNADGSMPSRTVLGARLVNNYPIVPAPADSGIPRPADVIPVVPNEPVALPANADGVPTPAENQNPVHPDNRRVGPDILFVSAQ